jgi:hypothetical protein
MQKTLRYRGYIVGIVMYFCGCGGPQPTMSQVRFVGWSQVQETKHWYDFSGATFSCLTFYTASKMISYDAFSHQAIPLPGHLRILQKGIYANPVDAPRHGGHSKSPELAVFCNH